MGITNKLMITERDILFRRLKEVAIRNPYRSESFKKFVRELRDTPGYDFHHVFGSMGKVKSTDLLGVMRKHLDHMQIHSERERIIELIPEAIENLIKYVIYLEGRNIKS